MFRVEGSKRPTQVIFTVLRAQCRYSSSTWIPRGLVLVVESASRRLLMHAAWHCNCPGREAPPRLSSILFGGTQHTARLCPPFGYSTFFTKNITLLGSTTKNATHVPGFLTNIRSFTAGFTRRR